MFYIKKAIVFLINPMVIFTIAAGVSLFLYYCKKEKKSFKVLFGATLYVFLLSLPIVSQLLARPLESQNSPLNQAQKVSFIAVLGSGNSSNEGDWPSSLKLGDTARSRLMEGLRQAQLNPEAQLIFFGFSLKDNVPHGEVMAKAAEELGLEKDRIVFSTQPRDTNEEASFAKEVVGGESLILVTTATHMVRAKQIFKSHGLEVVAAPANYSSYGSGWFVPMPSAGALDVSYQSIYEYVGLAWVNLRLLFS